MVNNQVNPEWDAQKAEFEFTLDKDASECVVVAMVWDKDTPWIPLTGMLPTALKPDDFQGSSVFEVSPQRETLNTQH